MDGRQARDDARSWDQRNRRGTSSAPIPFSVLKLGFLLFSYLSRLVEVRPISRKTGVASEKKNLPKISSRRAYHLGCLEFVRPDSRTRSIQAIFRSLHFFGPKIISFINFSSMSSLLFLFNVIIYHMDHPRVDEYDIWPSLLLIVADLVFSLLLLLSSSSLRHAGSWIGMGPETLYRYTNINKPQDLKA